MHTPANAFTELRLSRRPAAALPILLLVLVIGCASVPRREVVRLGPAEAEERVRTANAILVCAYAEDQKCGDKMLEGALMLSELADEKSHLARDQILIFYCA